MKGLESEVDCLVPSLEYKYSTSIKQFNYPVLPARAVFVRFLKRQYEHSHQAPEVRGKGSQVRHLSVQGVQTSAAYLRSHNPEIPHVPRLTAVGPKSAMYLGR